MSAAPITRKAEIEARLAELGYKMEFDLGAIDGEGHTVVEIATDEMVDPPEGEVMDLAIEWNLIVDPVDD